MYHVSAQGADEHMINVHYYYVHWWVPNKSITINNRACSLMTRDTSCQFHSSECWNQTPATAFWWSADQSTTWWPDQSTTWWPDQSTTWWPDQSTTWWPADQSTTWWPDQSTTWWPDQKHCGAMHRRLEFSAQTLLFKDGMFLCTKYTSLIYSRCGVHSFLHTWIKYHRCALKSKNSLYCCEWVSEHGA